MKELTKSMEKLPLIVKLILCIPFLDIVWSVWKLLKGIISGDVLKIILGILCIIPGAARNRRDEKRRPIGGEEDP